MMTFKYKAFHWAVEVGPTGHMQMGIDAYATIYAAVRSVLALGCSRPNHVLYYFFSLVHPSSNHYGECMAKTKIEIIYTHAVAKKNSPGKRMELNTKRKNSSKQSEDAST